MNNESTNIPIPFSYATIYIPFQCMTEVFDPENSLAYGTIFPELVDEYTKYLR